MCVPEPPEPISIQAQNAQRIREWISRLKGLSSRISLIPRRSGMFEDFLTATERSLRRRLKLGEDDKLIGWPTANRVAFMIRIDSGLPNPRERFELSDVCIFCFGNLAFAPTQFGWDGDGEKGEFPNTFSLDGCPEDTTSWNFIYGLIVDRVREIENQVPPPPA